LKYSATMMSSKPMTEMSRGHARPASRMARMAPMAEVSLKQKRAVKSRVQEGDRAREGSRGRGPEVFLEEDAEFRTDDDADLAGDGGDRLPAGLRVEGVALAFHEGDAAVAEVVEVAKRHAGGDVVIEHDVGDAGISAVRGDADDGDADL
jgi:hypothetical protein